MPINQWQNIQYIPSVDDVAKLSFSPNVIGMMRFIKYFNYYYQQQQKMSITYFENRFVINISCNYGFWISIGFLLQPMTNGNLQWFIEGNLYNCESGGSYHETGKFFVDYPISEMYNKIMTKIDSLNMIALSGGCN